MPHQYQMIELSKDLNPVIKSGMQGVILEVYNEDTFEVEFVKNDGSNYGYNGIFTFTISIDYFKL